MTICSAFSWRVITLMRAAVCAAHATLGHGTPPSGIATPVPDDEPEATPDPPTPEEEPEVTPDVPAVPLPALEPLASEPLLPPGVPEGAVAPLFEGVPEFPLGVPVPPELPAEPLAPL
jgi:hypothetical protein